jgi:hypothetical protein
MSFEEGEDVPTSVLVLHQEEPEEIRWGDLLRDNPFADSQELVEEASRA